MLLQAFRQKDGEAGAVVPSDTLAELLSFRKPSDAVSAAIRKAQLEALVRLVPVTISSQLLAALLVCLSLRSDVPSAQRFAWFGAMLIICVLRGGRALRVRIDPDYAARKPPELRAIVVVISILATLWLVPPIFWFASANLGEQMILCVLGVGLMSAATISLASVPQAALPYLAIMCAGGMVMAAQLNGSRTIIALELLYTWVLMWAAILNARRFVSHVRAQLELQEQSELIRLLREFEASGSDWLWEIDADHRLRYMSQAMADAFGKPLRELIGKRAISILDPDGRAASLSTGLRIISDHAAAKTPFKDIAIPVRYGTHWWSLSGKPLIDSSGKFLGWRGVGSDITDVRLTGTDSVRAARLDPLTGLANRVLVREQLEEALLRGLSSGSGCALFLVDLDRFKLVNDTLGHAVGDLLLCEVASRLRIAAKEGMAGRLGGDEFALVWHGDADRKTLARAAEHIIAELARPFAIGGTTIHVGATVGIALSPDDGRNEGDLIRSADLALYRAKANGRGGHAFFAPWMAEQAVASRRLESDLRSALTDGSLSLAYQPIVDARTRQVVAREALLRWTHPERGEVPPDTFIPIIEEAGLIGQVGAWVIREACAEAATWSEELALAVNVSPIQLGGADLESTVVNALAASALAPFRLELEVTESVFLSDDPLTREALRRLRDLGMRLVLDDFGTGYSSFGALARGEFSKIKIDRSFVSGVAAGDCQARSIVEAMVGLARGLGLLVTAEGVETADQADMLAALGCDRLQGFHFGRPMTTGRQRQPVLVASCPDFAEPKPLRRRAGSRH
jgi:diguanylate cyclase (GGDEF)-like protein